MQKWEYLFVNTLLKGDTWYAKTANGKHLNSKSDTTMYDFANQMGEDGWELVSAPYTSDQDNRIKPRLIFKRPKA